MFLIGMLFYWLVGAHVIIQNPTINPYGVLISRREEEEKIMPSLMATSALAHTLRSDRKFVVMVVDR